MGIRKYSVSYYGTIDAPSGECQFRTLKKAIKFVKRLERDPDIITLFVFRDGLAIDGELLPEHQSRRERREWIKETERLEADHSR